MTSQVHLLSFLYLAVLLTTTIADIFFHQKLDPEKQFRSFAYGIVGHLVFFLRLLSDVPLVQVFL